MFLTGLPVHISYFGYILPKAVLLLSKKSTLHKENPATARIC